MYINTFKYRPEDVACVLCAEYVKKLGCTALSCPCLAERMEAGTVGYAEAVAELFPYRPRLTARIMRLAERFPGTMWQDAAHPSSCRRLPRLAVAGRTAQAPLHLSPHPAGLPEKAGYAGIPCRAVPADLQQGDRGQELQLLHQGRHRLPLRPPARYLPARLHAAHGGKEPLLRHG